jgi:hypothetical protein
VRIGERRVVVRIYPSRQEEGGTIVLFTDVTERRRVEALRLPLLGTTPGLPVGPLADLPLPSRWTLRFGDPVDLEGLGPEAAGDAAAVSRLAGRVRDTLQAMLDEGLAARRSVFL